MANVFKVLDFPVQRTLIKLRCFSLKKFYVVSSNVIGLTVNALVILKEFLNVEYIILRSHDVSCNEARVFHYRNCPAPCDMPAEMEVDITLQKYGERLKKKLNHPIIHKKM